VCQAPKLLLLDEPTNHLDPAAKGALLTAAMQLGITVVTALHDLTLIDDFATHVAVLKDGSLAGFGHPSDIINPQIIQEIFGVQMFRLQHPNKQRMLSSLDVMMGGQNGFFVNKKSSLTNNQISLSVENGELLLGTWQGIYLFEHRLDTTTRTVIHHYIGD